jgi:hypothetical protein
MKNTPQGNWVESSAVTRSGTANNCLATVSGHHRERPVVRGFVTVPPDQGY